MTLLSCWWCLLRFARKEAHEQLNSTRKRWLSRMSESAAHFFRLDPELEQHDNTLWPDDEGTFRHHLFQVVSNLCRSQEGGPATLAIELLRLSWWPRS